MASKFTVEQLLLDEGFLLYCLNPDEKNSKKWEEMIASKEVDIEAVEEAKSILRMLSPSLGPNEIAAEIEKIKELITSDPLPAKPAFQQPFSASPAPLQKRKSLKKVLLFSLLVIGISLTGYYLISVRSETNQAPVYLAEFQTKTGEQRKIILPDGTSVILNSNSLLAYHEGYNVKDRKVFLSGKAFFTVSKNAGKPFSVSNTHFQTTALGTSFYISADSGEHYTVRLLEGKVRIEDENNSKNILLEPGEEASWIKGEQNFQRMAYDTSYLNEWLTGVIVFKKTPVAEAFSKLGNWYGVQIEDRRTDKKVITINGTYDNVLLEDILKIICFSLGCNIRYIGEKIIIQ